VCARWSMCVQGGACVCMAYIHAYYVCRWSSKISTSSSRL